MQSRDELFNRFLENIREGRTAIVFQFLNDSKNQVG
jgi:hypothetical protein